MSGVISANSDCGCAVVYRRVRGERGSTLIEVMIVMTILAILLSIAVPMYQRSAWRAKEIVLRNNLYTLRQTIAEYTIAKQRAPQTLQELTAEGYLRQIPVDPITGSDQWRTTTEDSLTAVNLAEPGIGYVRSSSDAKSLEGT